LQQGDDFAFETTLSTRSYVGLVKQAQNTGYRVSLLYFWLPSPEFAKQRVAERVSKGGHTIPADVIERRYYRGIHNLVNLYIPVVDDWALMDNTDAMPGLICRGAKNEEKDIINTELWHAVQEQSKYHDN
jgi:predicted ABC-type ATPase